MHTRGSFPPLNVVCISCAGRLHTRLNPFGQRQSLLASPPPLLLPPRFYLINSTAVLHILLLHRDFHTDSSPEAVNCIPPSLNSLHTTLLLWSTPALFISPMQNLTFHPFLRWTQPFLPSHPHANCKSRQDSKKGVVLGITEDGAHCGMVPWGERDRGRGGQQGC